MNHSLFRQPHPLVIICYYLVMLLVVMSTTNPVIISSCFVASLVERFLYLNGKSKKSVLYPLVFLAIITMTNPLFVHRGATILFFLFNKPITMEAFVYGFFMGLMIVTVIYLFQNLQKAVNSEQFFYLFGERFPKSTLILTLVFRFIPSIQYYYQELNQVQKTLHRSQRQGVKERANYGLDLFGNLFSWSLESAMDTADSMKARGYGVQARSSRLNYVFRKRDKLFLVTIICVGSFFIFRMMAGDYQFNYYPYQDNLYILIQEQGENYLYLVLFAFLPVLWRLWEVIMWAILKLKI
ncbi:energy-coupling factor transporter transmembrane component T [Candidatus Enterococcus mansonii]|uniref:Cobalt transporter n=1 Tax=Candidatus Enterococcus mansonii TaxID=1834181 RepID=A0A242CIY6_9ENTE|nr:energy-coupling factor transporter transmembrane component T [Enterococcus sp. 4G2_DIV0659]OTO10204.1 hypothetical protein A5880_000887 [Enterococcus sp. 4G2_DIV0659]